MPILQVKFDPIVFDSLNIHTEWQLTTQNKKPRKWWRMLKQHSFKVCLFMQDMAHLNRLVLVEKNWVPDSSFFEECFVCGLCGQPQV